MEFEVLVFLKTKTSKTLHVRIGVQRFSFVRIGVQRFSFVRIEVRGFSFFEN